jgi:N-methylhydantoinase A
VTAPTPGLSRIGVDIGGTFTDLVWVDEATGTVRVAKLLTTPKEPAHAVEEGIVALLAEAASSPATSWRSAARGATTCTTSSSTRRRRWCRVT